MRPVVVAAAVAFGAAGFASDTGARSDGMSGAFFLAGRTVYCGTELFPHEGTARFLSCWRPSNGFVVSMTHRGRASAARNSGYRELRLPGDGALRSGETWWVSRTREVGRGTPPRGAFFRCTARPKGLSCANAVGRGWWVGRLRGYRLIK